MSQRQQDSSSVSFWDIDDILAEEEIVLTKFLVNSYQNGQLTDLNNPDLDIQKDQTVDLPLWLAIPLCQG
jgi:hypothetical protein